MQELSEIKEAITKLVKDRCHSPGSFDEFTAQLSKLNVVRQTYDVINNELFFYSDKQLLLALPVSNIDQAQNGHPFTIGKTLKLAVLKKAIVDFDSGVILSATEFHQQIALAGIVYVSVHLIPRKIYYLSQDAQYYLESY